MKPAFYPFILLAKKCRCRQAAVLFLISVCLSIPSNDAFAQQRVLDIGIRIQKTVNLYYENGISLQYSADRLASKRLYVGFSYISSRLGTAMGSNAIPQDNFLLSGSFFFRPNSLILPMVRANIGYFRAELDPIFKDLPQHSLLLSPEAGICIDPENPFKLIASLGYNVIGSNGISGPGTLYPLFLQTSLSWDIFYLKGNRK